MISSDLLERLADAADAVAVVPSDVEVYRALSDESLSDTMRSHARR
jgi:hypothetical protein